MRTDTNPISATVETVRKWETPAGDYWEFLVRTVDVLPSAGSSYVSNETVVARIEGWKAHGEVTCLRVSAGFTASEIFGFGAPLTISGESKPGKDLEVGELTVRFSPTTSSAADGVRCAFALAAMARFLHTELLGYRVPSPFGEGVLVLKD